MRTPTRTLATAAMVIASMGVATLPAAQAAPVSAPVARLAAADVNPANIDPDAATTLTINKYLGSPTGAPANGTQQTVALPPLSGVVFDVYQVSNPDGTPVDLATSAGWAAATALQGHQVTAAEIAAGQLTQGGQTYRLTLKASPATGTTGAATYTQTGPGLFLVAENLGKSTTVTNQATGQQVPTSSITPSAPYLVTLPMTNPGGDQWMYTVHTYPKNTSDSITKQVDDASDTQGSVSTAMGDALTGTARRSLDYTLTGSITPGMSGEVMGSYVLIDELPEGVTFTGVRSVATSTGTTLAAGTDYTVYVGNTPWTGGSAPDGATVQIALTATGRGKIAAAKAADPAATVVAHVLADATTPAGDLTNTAYLVPSDSWYASTHDDPTYDPETDTPPTDLPSNPVASKFGSAVVTKTDAQGGATLQGAVFDLYSGIVTQQDPGKPAATDCSSVVTNDAAKIMSGLTTDAQGTVTITGLQRSDFYDDVQQPTTGGKYIVYCLVETKAPEGYNLNAQPTAFDVLTSDAAAPATVSVQDEKTNLGNSLPLTGGSGATAVGVGGLVIVGATLAARAAAKRRRDDEIDDLV